MTYFFQSKFGLYIFFDRSLFLRSAKERFFFFKKKKVFVHKRERHLRQKISCFFSVNILFLADSVYTKFIILCGEKHTCLTG